MWPVSTAVATAHLVAWLLSSLQTGEADVKEIDMAISISKVGSC